MKKTYTSNVPAVPGPLQTRSQYLKKCIVFISIGENREKHAKNYYYKHKGSYMFEQKKGSYISHYPLLDSSLRTSSKLSMPLYSIPVTIPSGFDNVTRAMPLSITTWSEPLIHYQYKNISLKTLHSCLVSAGKWTHR